MILRKKIWVALLLCLMISSCSSTKSRPSEDRQRMIDTAKINAQLGIAYLEQNNVTRSRHKLLKAMSQAPEAPEVWYSMGYFLESTGSKHEAQTHYKKAIALDPERGDSLNNYGTFLCRSGDYESAINHFLKAVNDNSYLDPADAYENAGLCALKIPDSEQAEVYFKRALVEDSARPLSVIKLAELYYKRKDYKVSKTHLERFLALSPPTAESNRLHSLLALSDVPKSIRKKAIVKLNSKKIIKHAVAKKSRKSFKSKKRLAHGKSVLKHRVAKSKLTKKATKKLAVNVSNISKVKPVKRKKVHRIAKNKRKHSIKKPATKKIANAQQARQHASNKPALTISPGEKHKKLIQHDTLVKNNAFERSMQIA